MQDNTAKPTTLEELPQDIQDLKNIELSLTQFQAEYKEKVGLSEGHADANLPFHPKALEMELQDIKDHLKNLERNRFNSVWKKKFLEYLFQEPPLQITQEDLHNLENKNRALKTKFEEYTAEMDNIKQEIKSTTESVAKLRSKSFSRVDSAVKALEEINAMESELIRIGQLLAHESELTEGDAQRVLTKQAEAMAEYNTQIDQKKDAIEELQWKVEDLQEEVDTLKKVQDEKKVEAGKQLRENETRDMTVEEHYTQYKEATEACNRMTGVESIKYESLALLHITYAKPLNGVLSINIDVNEKDISNATLTGSDVKISDVLKMVTKMSVNEGIRTIMIETMARLKRQYKQQQQAQAQQNGL